METDLTKAIKAALWKFTDNQGTFGCEEVTIGWFGNERVDYMTYDVKDTFRCYEIKISKPDFHSKNYNSFCRNQWVIIGAETGNRKEKVVPKREWIEKIVEACNKAGVPVSMKGSLAKVWGAPLIQEFPWEESNG